MIDDTAVLRRPRWYFKTQPKRRRDEPITTISDYESEPKSLHLAPWTVSLESETYWFQWVEGLSHPVWLDELFEEVNELINLPDDWDSYGGQPVSLKPALTALGFLRVLLATRWSVPQPQLSSTEEGRIQFEWHKPGLDLEIEFGFDEGPYLYYYDATGGEEWTKHLSEVWTSLNTYLARFETD